MASVSAFVSIGSSHPNENGFSPEWIVELWEGDRAVWVLRSFDGVKKPKKFKPASPARIYDSFVEVLEHLYPGSTKTRNSSTTIALAVVILEDSTFLKSARKCRTLKNFDVHMAPVSWSRTWSMWKNKWIVTGK